MEIVGVLLLQSNKTFGKKKDKSYYKFIPYDKTKQPLLVPYKPKEITFSKVSKNKYCLVKALSNDKGELTNVIGDVDNIESYYEYELYGRNLHESSNIKNLKEKLLPMEHTLPKRDEYIFSIDPKNCKDIDDAISISSKKISIYIANVAYYMEKYDLWECVKKKVSSIYLPNKIISLFPKVLSENYFSLLKNTERVAFTMDIYFENKEIKAIKYSNNIIQVSNNYEYEEKDLLQNISYQLLYKTLQDLNLYSIPIQDSHDVIQVLMVYMNHFISKELYQEKEGIFRNCLSMQHLDVIYHKSHYVCYDKKINHELLELDSYLHITSPIRRLVDIVNQIVFQEKKQIITFSTQGKEFVEKHKNNLDYINETHYKINKLQKISNFICMNKEIYEGEIIEIIPKENSIKYKVYIKELKNVFSFQSTEKYEKKLYSFKLYIICADYKNKVKLEIIFI